MKVRRMCVALVAIVVVYLSVLIPERLYMKDAMKVFKSFTEVTALAQVNISSLLTLPLQSAALVPGNQSDYSVNDKSHVLGAQTPANQSYRRYTTKSPLYDQTIDWDADLHRPWLDKSAPDPPAMLLLTTFGWNQPNQTAGLELYRGYRTREFLDGIVNHPWFHPTAWEDINSQRIEVSNTTRYYVFLDIEQCAEKNYPRYGWGVFANMDKVGNRSSNSLRHGNYFSEHVMRSPVMQANSKYILFECGGFGPKKEHIRARKSFVPKEKLALISLSNTRQNAEPWDQGLPPPACRTFNFTSQEELDILICNESSRTITISFRGQVSRSQPRRDLANAHDGKRVWSGGRNSKYEGANSTDLAIMFEALAKHSLFSATPKGDNLFSYRFSEVLGLASIPVVYADDWLMPFGEDLIDWTEAAVFIREKDANKTLDILSAISPKARCRMRQRGLEIYRNYMDSGRGIIKGIIENFELSATRKPSYTGPQQTNPTVGRSKAEYCGPDNVASPLGDKTLCWKSNIDRLWLNRTAPNPPVMLLLTSYRMAKRVRGKRYSRTLRTRELIEAVVNHPWFYPLHYEELLLGRSQASNETLYLIFQDSESCSVSNYPIYGGGERANLDYLEGRSNTEGNDYRDRTVVRRIIEHMSSTGAENWQMVWFDCNRIGPFGGIRVDEGRRLMVASSFARTHQLTPGLDIGLPAPRFRPFELSEGQRVDIMECKRRRFLLSFVGDFISMPRKELKLLHNNSTIIVREPSHQKDEYFELMLESSFVAVPRGRSFPGARLAEAMSSGAIPVIIADEWALPLAPLINWADISFVVPERRVETVEQVLSSVSEQQVCEMRQRMISIYDRYMANAEGHVRGLVEARYKLQSNSTLSEG